MAVVKLVRHDPGAPTGWVVVAMADVVIDLSHAPDLTPFPPPSGTEVAMDMMDAALMGTDGLEDVLLIAQEDDLLVFKESEP